MFLQKKGALVLRTMIFFFLITFLAACNSSTPTVTPTPQATRPLSSGNGGGTGRIAFTCLLSSSSATTICLSALDGSGLRTFTHLPTGACCPRWSPDGRRIAFLVASGSSGNFSDIWVMNADGSSLVNLTHAPQQVNLGPSWSPDGKQIVFSALFGDKLVLYLMHADGSQRRPLHVDLEGEFPAWSPDGRKIAFISSLSDTLSTVYVMNADGSDVPIRVARAPGFYSSLIWSPDSKHLLYAYASDSLGQSDMYMMNADGSGPVRLTNSPATFNGTLPTSWSPDGTKILFERVHRYGAYLRSTEVTMWVMNADGSGQTRLSLPAQADGDAVWQS